MNVVVNLKVSALRLPVRVLLLISVATTGLTIHVQSAKALGLDPFGLVRRQARLQIVRRLGPMAEAHGAAVEIPMHLPGISLTGDLAANILN